MTPEKSDKVRRALGRTQSEQGAILNTAPQTIRKWEMPVDRSTARSVNPVAARAVAWFLSGLRPTEWPDRKP